MTEIYSISVVLIIILLFTLYTVFKQINIKFDWNYETGERLLWFNNPLNIYERKVIVLYKDITKIKKE